MTLSDEHRPNPDEILKNLKNSQSKRSRGKLKVFFGMCPGVGKTYAMLRAAHQLQSTGLNVLVGIVETHQRVDTEKLLEGLNVLPRKKMQYKEREYEEFDIDAVLEKRPDLVLVDELAHSNIQGSRHPKRFQDVQELLLSGLDVYTTLNVQHIESRADLVFQIAGVPVRETVPDAFLELADQIELIDLSPDELIERLRIGKVYKNEQAEKAENHFFKIEKLTALRELALRFTAEIVDDQLRHQMQMKRIFSTWNTNDRLMVAISHSPSSAKLIRSARRMASNLESPWVALHVDTGLELSKEDHEMLTKNLNMARELGAEVLTTKDRSVSAALKRVALERNVTQIVIGRPVKRFFKDLFSKGTVLDQLIYEASEIDIHIIRQKRKTLKNQLSFKTSHSKFQPMQYLKTFIYVLLLCIVSLFFLKYVGYRAIGFTLLLGILPISTFYGMGPILFSAALSAILWNFLFIPPQFTFEISETEDFMMILAYFSVATVAGYLASRVKQQEKDLRLRETRANILYEFGKRLADAETKEKIIVEAIRSIELAFSSTVFIGLPNTPNGFKIYPEENSQTKVSEKDQAVAHWSFFNQKKAGWKTDTLSSANCLCVPLRGKNSNPGVLIFYPNDSRSLSLDQENLIETICVNTGIALERESLGHLKRQNELYEKSEILHQNLLNTISHELRTPLTAIVGGVSALSLNPLNENMQNEKLVLNMLNSAERLNQTIENLMDMSRLSSGVLKLKEDLFELNDFLRNSTQRIQNQNKSLPIVLELSDEDFYTRGDEKILEHVLLNLISNATHASSEGSLIKIISQKNKDFVEFLVVDEGMGIKRGDELRIFERFFRSEGSRPGGVGLGLSISKAMIEAHHGKIIAMNRTDRSGALFKVSLPSVTLPREVFQNDF